MALTILEGSTFCICDELGDLASDVGGLFAQDTRFLSLFVLTVDGEAPLLLSSGRVEYFSAAFYTRNPLTETLPQDVLSIARHRFVGGGMQDRIVVRNESRAPRACVVGVRLGTDFADILTVKQHDFSLGNPSRADPLPPLAHVDYDRRRSQVLLREPEGPARTQIVVSRRGRLEDDVLSFDLELEPHAEWDLCLDVVGSLDGNLRGRASVTRRFGTEREHVRASLEAWSLRLPRLTTSIDELDHAFDQSVADLAALRLRAGEGPGQLPAAGMPWFMTVFGRDTIVTSLQSLVLGPELAYAALETLAALQAREDDPSIDAEPGKIVHELRQGRAAAKWFARYYGTVDATPLYLVLLSETWRWTGDHDLVHRLRGPALAALEWIDRYGDRDGDGFVEFERRSDGLEVQSWKDSHDSQRFSDGRVAKPPIAPAEVQGYVVDAKRRVAELARVVWDDEPLAARLEAEAAVLAQRFDEAFWVEERGGYYALALDGEKRPVDSLCSNIGHLLWSGIVPTHRADALVDRLTGPELWSGWGFRTMSTHDVGYNPLAYHNGTVWPHDTALVAWGLSRYGEWPFVRLVTLALLDAARHFDWSLPEVFAGYDRASTPFPIAYPTAARPQAWAAGTPILLLRLLLGLEPDVTTGRLRTTAADLPLPGERIVLSGVRALGATWEVVLDGDGTAVREAGP